MDEREIRQWWSQLAEDDRDRFRDLASEADPAKSLEIPDNLRSLVPAAWMIGPIIAGWTGAPETYQDVGAFVSIQVAEFIRTPPE